MTFASYFTLSISRWLLPAIVVFWFCIALIAIDSVGKSKFKDFDPELRLSSELMSLSMETELTDILSTVVFGTPKETKQQEALNSQSYSVSNASANAMLSSHSNDDNGTIIHVVQGNCYCEKLSIAHQQSLNEWASNEGIGHRNLNVSDLPELRRFVPSTPAVIVLNKVNELIYLGPYSVGMGCFEDEGLVDSKIKPYFSGTAATLPATIQSEAKGCYCATQPLLENI